MVKLNEALRDPRTGLLLPSRLLLREIAQRKGGRGVLEIDRDIAALARVVIDIHDRLEGNVPAPEPERVVRKVERGDPGWKERTQWKPASAQAAAEDMPEQEAAPEPLPERRERRAHAKTSRPSVVLDAIGTVLGSVEGRWWEAREIAEALVKVGAVDSLDSELVSRKLTQFHRRRGWVRRPHPAAKHHWQYQAGPVAEGGAL